MDILKSIYNFLCDLVYPDNLNCLACKEPISRENSYSLCKECFDTIEPISYACQICGKPLERQHDLISLENDEICNFCRGKKFSFARNISCLAYDDYSKCFVLPMKYKGHSYLGKICSQIIEEKLRFMDNFNDFDLGKVDYLMAVPLSKRRHKKRLYNQSDLIAKALSESLSISYSLDLKRTKDTKRLFKLDEKARKKELRGAFTLENKEKYRDKTLLIVDDIFTTGSTLDEIAKILKISGVKEVITVTLLVKKSV